MGAPLIIPGGETDLGDGRSWNATQSSGVFAKFPGATPKYALNQGPRDNEFRETMARMFIQMPEKERNQFVQSCPPETRPLAKILCGVGEGASGGTGFMDFLLTQAVEPFQEKFQVVESLSDNFIIYVFGQQAPQFQYGGKLLNTWQDDQRVWMLRLYRDILRGTQLARRRKLVRLRYDSVIISGVMVAQQQTVMGTEENSVDFAFTLIPTQYTIFTPAVGAPTKLKTPFTSSSGYALKSTAVPDSTKQRIASPSRPPLPSKTRSNEPQTGHKVEKASKTALQEVKERTQALESKTPTTIKNVRGGQVKTQ
jgi:hypothetical protein